MFVLSTYSSSVCDRPIPGREFVEVYIKAYYLPEAQLETWIHDHKVMCSVISTVRCVLFADNVSHSARWVRIDCRWV